MSDPGEDYSTLREDDSASLGSSLGGARAAFCGEFQRKVVKCNICSRKNTAPNPLVDESPFAWEETLPWGQGTSMKPRGDVCKPCIGAWQGGAWAEEFGDVEKYHNATADDSTITDCFEESRSLWIEAHNRGQARIRSRKSAAYRKRKGQSTGDRLMELRRTRKKIVKRTGREQRIRTRVRIMTPKAFKTRYGKTIEEDNRTASWHMVKGKRVWGVKVKLDKDGEWEMIDDDLDAVEAQESVESDDQPVLRADQQERRMEFLQRDMDAMVTEAMPEPEPPAPGRKLQREDTNASRKSQQSVGDDAGDDDDDSDSDVDMGPAVSGSSRFRPPPEATDTGAAKGGGSAKKPPAKPSPAKPPASARPSATAAAARPNPLGRAPPPSQASSSRAPPSSQASSAASAAGARSRSPRPRQGGSAPAPTTLQSGAAKAAKAVPSTPPRSVSPSSRVQPGSAAPSAGNLDVLKKTAYSEIVQGVKACLAEQAVNPAFQAQIDLKNQRDAMRASAAVTSKISGFLSKATNAVHAIKRMKRTHKGGKDDEFDGAIQAVTDLQGRLTSVQKVFQAVCAQRPDSVAFDNHCTKALELGPLPPYILMKRVSGNTQACAKRQDFEEASETLREGLQAIAEGDRQMIVHDVVEKCLMKICPSTGRAVKTGAALVALLHAFAESIVGGEPLASGPQNEHLTILRDATLEVGRDPDPAVVERVSAAMDKIEAGLGEESILSFLLANSHFKDLLPLIKKTIKEEDKSAPSQSKYVDRLAQHLQELADLERNEASVEEIFACTKLCALDLNRCLSVAASLKEGSRHAANFTSALDSINKYADGILIDLNIWAQQMMEGFINDPNWSSLSHVHSCETLARRLNDFNFASVPDRWSSHAKLFKDQVALVGIRVKFAQTVPKVVKAFQEHSVKQDTDAFNQLVTSVSTCKLSGTQSKFEDATPGTMAKFWAKFSVDAEASQDYDTRRSAVQAAFKSLGTCMLQPSASEGDVHAAVAEAARFSSTPSILELKRRMSFSSTPNADEGALTMLPHVLAVCGAKHEIDGLKGKAPIPAKNVLTCVRVHKVGLELLKISEEEMIVRLLWFMGASASAKSLCNILQQVIKDVLPCMESIRTDEVSKVKPFIDKLSGYILPVTMGKQEFHEKLKVDAIKPAFQKAKGAYEELENKLKEWDPAFVTEATVVAAATTLDAARVVINQGALIKLTMQPTCCNPLKGKSIRSQITTMVTLVCERKLYLMLADYIRHLVEEAIAVDGKRVVATPEHQFLEDIPEGESASPSGGSAANAAPSSGK